MGTAQGQGTRQDKPRRDAGSLSDLLEIAVYDEDDIDSAVAWWDEHASDAWQGALEE